MCGILFLRFILTIDYYYIVLLLNFIVYYAFNNKGFLSTLSY